MGLFTVTFAGLGSTAVPVMVEAADRNDALTKAVREIPQIVRNDPTAPFWYCHDGDMEEKYRRDPNTRKSFADWLQEHGYVHDDRRIGSGGYFRLISIEKDSKSLAFSLRERTRPVRADRFERRTKSEDEWIRGLDELPTDDAVKILRDRYLIFHKQPYEIRIANDSEVFNWIVRYRNYDERVSEGDAASLNDIRFSGFLNILANPDSVLELLEMDASEGIVEAMYLRDELRRLSAKYSSTLPTTAKKDVPRLPKRKYKRVNTKSKAKTVKQIPKKKTGRK